MRRVLLLVFLCAASGVVLSQNVVPPVPSNLSAELSSGMMPGVRLAWEAPPGPWGFRIYRRVNDATDFQTVGVSPMLTFLDRTVVPGNAYSYYLTSVAINSPGALVESDPSDTVSISVPARPPAVAGTIRGTVIDDTTGLPIAGVRMSFYRTPAPAWFTWPPHVVTGPDGVYEAKLDTGTYKIYAEPPPWMPPAPPPYRPEWFDNAPDIASATPVAVAENASVVADFGLSRIVPPDRPKGTIRGTVTDDLTQAPIPHVKILFFRKDTPWAWLPHAVTDDAGAYEALLDTGTYFIRAQPFRDPDMMNAQEPYQPEWYDNALELRDATPVAVAPGSAFVADFSLGRVQMTLVSVEGKVTDEQGLPLRRAQVAILIPPPELGGLWSPVAAFPNILTDGVYLDALGYCRGVVWKGLTDSLGQFRARVASGRSYIAVAAKSGYVPEFYDNKPDPLSADLIKVEADVVGIDFSLAPQPALTNSISGLVRDEAGTGIPSMVILFPVRPSMVPMRVRFGHTDEAGAYTIGRLPAGSYIILAVPYGDYAPAFYKKDAYGVFGWKDADTVVVSGEVTGIDIGVVPVHHVGLTRLAGRVTGSDGAPLEGVRLMAAAGGHIYGYAVTDASGFYVLEQLPAITLRIVADIEGYQSAERGVTISPMVLDLGGVNFTLTRLAATSTGESGRAPVEYMLHQNFPNPFNPATTITFDLPAPGVVHVAVHNLLGQEVVSLASGPVPAGRHAVRWDGADDRGRAVASGLYFARLVVTGADGSSVFTQVRKMMLMK